MKQDTLFYVFNDEKLIPEPSKTTLVVSLDGKEYPSLSKLYHRLNKSFQFGGSFGNNLDALFDSMTDLSWLNESKFIISVTNTENFLADEDFTEIADFLNTLNDIAGSINDEPLFSNQNRSMTYYFQAGPRIEEILDDSYLIWEVQD